MATGVYTPSIHITETFHLRDSIAIYGGFAGTETILEERDWIANPTVLSGDIDGNDITDPDGVVTTTINIIGNNSSNVVTGHNITHTAVLDGFIITAGKGGGGQSIGYCQSCGGGMYNEMSSPTLTNLTFRGNLAVVGGAMYNTNSSHPSLTDVSFDSNRAVERGGAVYNKSNSNPTLTDVAFTFNTVGGFMPGAGGGMYNQNSSPSLINVVFAHNTSGMNNAASSPVLNEVIFDSNSGRGMTNVANSTPSLTNVRFYHQTGRGMQTLIATQC
ncbi:MAG: hypothetical protein IPL28_08545 [Chloroflexi bacterium]|nr:hypothetical protein [Chloroflexota bacterium]